MSAREPGAADRMEPIAIVGMAGRMPGAENLQQFWSNLRDGVESIAFFSDEELAAAGVDPALLRNPRYVRARGVLQGAELFDAGLFGLSPREAEIMDPQHRVFLETAWEALENAGYAPGVVALAAGVYAGASLNSYLIASLMTNPEVMLAAGAYQAMLANDKDFLATRVSYKLNLKGPGVTIQTACSTSLVAVQMACQALLTRQCDLALAGGVSINVPRVTGYLYEPGMILSPDGHCRAFDARAQGTVAGEGAGVVVLKRLRDALADGDHVRAVIRGAAINNDGSLKVGYTAPSVDGQAAVIARAHEMAGFDPSTITYVEAHGTGTELGDPIEIAALTKAFRAGTDRRGFCALGSVKTNIGHLDAAAGVAGLIKTVLALEHRALPPSLHFEAPNPNIDFGSGPFRVNAGLADWARSDDAPRRAGVSSFGIGGTNAHVVLEEAPAPPAPAPSRPVQVFTLSARSDEALERAGAALAGHLAEHSELALGDVAFTLHRGRATFPHRRAVVAASLDEAARVLREGDARRVLSRVEAGKDRPVVFMFSGQGSQYVGMGRGVYESEPLFREIVDRCAEALAPSLGLDLRTVLYPAPEAADAARARLATTAITQPALFVVEYALARLYMEWGLRPTAMLGHSIGEYVAATLAGVMSLDDALALVAERGRLMEVPGGAMLAVPLPEAEVRALLPATVAVAAVNGPALTAVSGPAADVAALQSRLESRGIRAQAIHVASAFHSAMMDPVLDAFRRAVGRVKLAAPAISYVSNVTGAAMTAADATDPGYWVRHLRQTVRFWDGLQEVVREQDPARLPVLLEVGPGRTLASLARPASSASRPLEILSSIRHPQDDLDDAAVLQTTVGRLWLAGVPIDWAGYHGRESRRRVPLPTYPFERQRHWILPAAPGAERRERPETLGKRSDIARWFYAPTWRRAAATRPPRPADGATWLLFADEVGVGTAVAERLRTQGADVIMVVRGEKFARLESGDFTLGPDGRREYDRLVAELHQGRGFPSRVLHLWSVRSESSPAPADLDEVQARGFYSLLFLAQALAEARIRESIRLGVVVNNLHEVVGDAVLAPERATILGPARVIPQEYANIRCRVIDVALPPAGGSLAALATRLAGELDEAGEAPMVAYRAGHRWIQDLEPVPLPASSPMTSLRSRGVYVITGGMGGIGLVIARHLAETVQARLVLIGRSGLPPRTEWTQWLESRPAEDATADRIRAVQAIEASGGEVLALRADVADRAQLAAALAEGRKRFGAIHGVVHAAGIAGGGIIQLKTPEIADPVLQAKVQGTLALSELLADAELDFLLLCSSITAVMGGPGQVDYCGANAFLDAFARSRAGVPGPRVHSVNWDAWQEVGMAANTRVPAALAARRARELADAILPAEGVDVFARVLESPLVEVIVSTRDLPRLITLARQMAEAPEAAVPETTPAAPASAGGRAGLPTPFVAPTTELERTIAEIWQELLGIQPIGTQDDFFEAGGHSLLATQVMSRLHQRLGVDVPLRVLFEARTVAAFAERVDEVSRSAGEREEIEL
jgi:acyl transferase domain-containing protein/acyl carrier protein